MTNADYTAAIIENVDVVVTIDSFIAHLAGALGKKTFLLLPYVQEWRWANGTGNSYWYPNTKLVKQTVRGSWKEPIDFVINSVRNP
jgi:ADP-heptose:LPS heptosyltransferase